MGNGGLSYTTHFVHHIADAQPLAAKMVHDLLPGIVGHSFGKGNAVNLTHIVISMIVYIIAITLANVKR